MDNATRLFALWALPFTVVDELANNKHFLAKWAFYRDVVAHPILIQLFGVNVSFHGC
jgi:hypothetical protein